MNVLDNIKQAIDLLEQNEEYYEQLLNLQSETDRKIDYWLHYIELNKCDISKVYRIYKEIKRLREERRKHKNNIEIMRMFHENEGKLQNEANRKILLTQICKLESKQNNAKYNYDAYTQEEVDKILGIVSETDKK